MSAPLDQRPLNLDALRSFVAICDVGSFRAAAAHVHRSPSAISLQLAGLEEKLGERLLERDARRVRLTEAGETFLGYARRLLALSEEALVRTRGASLSGRLRLVAPHDLGVTHVPRLLTVLAQRHPDVVVDVQLAASEAVLSAIQSGEASVALFNDVGEPPIPAQEIASEPLAWLQGGPGFAVTQTPLPLAVAAQGCAWRQAAIDGLNRIGRDYRVAYASDSSAGQVAALRADLAIAALPHSLIAAGLTVVPESLGLPELPSTRIMLATDGSALAKAFSEFANQIASP